MKKMFISMLMGMMALGMMAQDSKFTVKGIFEEMGDTVAFNLMDTVSGQIHAVTGEMLEVTFDLNEATYLKVWHWQGGSRAHDERDFIIPAIPGETVVITRDGAGQPVLSGSQFYVDFNEAQQSLQPAKQALTDFIEQCKDKINKGAPQDQVMTDYQENFPKLVQNYIDTLTGYIKAHPDQDASAALIADLRGELEAMEAAQALLTPRARDGVAACLYKNVLEETRKEAEKDARLNSLEGNSAPDFTLNDLKGKPLALSSLRGKWVVIDFWGSWCGWCIKGMPKMKEYYTKYADKLEILGVDCNDTVAKWKAAVRKHVLPWLHVYWDKDDENGDNPLALYGVSGFPTKVVVNPEGVVAKVIVGEDPAFYDYLDEVLK